MDVAIVYESLFGNTRQIAEAVAEGVRSSVPDVRVELVPVRDATSQGVGDVDLLVVGGPTHMLRMSSGRTRASGVRTGTASTRGRRPVPLEPGAIGPGVREFLESLPASGAGRRAAAFDTRFGYPLGGGAAHSIRRRLRRRGFTVASAPRGFVVSDMTGPLRHGETDRAREWGAELGRQQVP